MKHLSHYVGEQIEVEISGHKQITGILIEIGTDIIVMYTKEGDFYYIPILHIQKVKIPKINETEEIINPGNTPINTHTDEISLRKIVNNAKGLFVEIFVTSKNSIHGYVTNLMNDYIVFYSPVFKTMFIPFHHLKWLIPYNPNQTPYGLDRQNFPVNPSRITLARTFEEQIKKLQGQMVVYDLGEDKDKIGQLKNIENNVIELVTAREESVFINTRHIKTLHFS
ncbi:DUF2642 domain-containing protein [Fredinandcohnia quinoae]|uniref:DUF2642 domain-containing protein n=1 Tax=Fredinandcohnia quinoae TaxID=2918902 RepID=A0AAW5E016_9BACI|nr:DUF2642 domain-containing protein [Fredinandcohnia sp. SECRCQ15]MCH1626250.1 DUF2642 domain-containing protein [Fredinandcohnia sp. SECRCQ15]